MSTDAPDSSPHPEPVEGAPREGASLPQEVSARGASGQGRSPEGGSSSSAQASGAQASTSGSEPEPARQQQEAPPQDVPRPPARRNPHLHGTTVSMVWSTLAVTALVLVFYALVVRPDQVARPSVDVRGVVGEARRATGWQLGTVEGLGDGWAPTVARLEPAADGLRTWQVRYVEGERRYVALTQTARASSGWVDAQVKGRPSAGGVRVGSVPLDSFASSSGCTLVRRGGEGLTSVIETGESCDRAMAYAARVTPALR